MYKPFLAHLTQVLEQFELTSRPIPAGLAHNVSNRGRSPATIQSWCYQCPEFRKIRYTYIDAGESAQIFNCVMYPNYQYDLPLLGVDLLSFGHVKNLTVLDFQPLFPEADYEARYIRPLATLRDRYPELTQPLETKVYADNPYFSKYLLFAKTNPHTVRTQVLSAFEDLLALYWQLMRTATPLTKASDIRRVMHAQQDYDQYNADHDPAAKLFSSYFGSEWSERFVHEFLFEDAKVPVAAPVLS